MNVKPVMGYTTMCIHLPRGGYSLKDSTHIGLDGSKLTIAASPLLIIFGLSSNFLPDLRSIFSLSSSNWNKSYVHV